MVVTDRCVMGRTDKHTNIAQGRVRTELQTRSPPAQRKASSSSWEGAWRVGNFLEEIVLEANTHGID